MNNDHVQHRDNPSRAESRATCPEPPELWRAMAGEMPVESRRDIVNHVFDCPECAWQWRLAKDLDALPKRSLITRINDAGRLGFIALRVRLGELLSWSLAFFPSAKKDDGEARRSFLELSPQLAMAVVAVLAVGLVLPERGTDPEYETRAFADLDPATPDRRIRSGDMGPSTHRAPGQRGSDTPAVASTLKEGITLPRDQFMLTWKGPVNSTFTLEIRTSDSKLFLRKKNLETTSFRVPPEKLEALPTGAKLYWQVTASGPNRSSARLKIFTVRVE